jgi:hypothetical protein
MMGDSAAAAAATAEQGSMHRSCVDAAKHAQGTTLCKLKLKPETHLLL